MPLESWQGMCKGGGGCVSRPYVSAQAHEQKFERSPCLVSDYELRISGFTIPHGSAGGLMSTTVCLWADTFGYPEGGGHAWVFLNWALGLRALGCRVIWLEGADPRTPVPKVRRLLAALKSRLQPYGLAERV